MSKEGRTQKKKSQELLVNLHDYFEREEANGGPLENIHEYQYYTLGFLGNGFKDIPVVEECDVIWTKLKDADLEEDICGQRRSWQGADPVSVKKVAEREQDILWSILVETTDLLKMLFSSGISTFDYHGDLNAEKFETWLKNSLLANLEEPSLIIMDNALNHIRHQHLHGRAKMRSSPRRYVVDELIQAHGHQVLRLPPYHCEFNPHRNGMVFYDNHILRNGYKHEMVLETWQQSIENVTTDN
ncbi:hypothetical protein CBL_02926 [Carabus blaptoides fortunei]